MAPTVKKIPVPELLGAGAVEAYNQPPVEAGSYSPSGLKTLDDLIMGAMGHELTLLAGQPGQGKTALAMQWAVFNAQEGRPAAVLSLEMGKAALRDRLVASTTGIPFHVLRTRRFKDAAQQELAVQAGRWLAELPLYVDGRSGLSAPAVYDTLTSWMDLGVNLAVIDYIQLISGTNDSRVVIVGDGVKAAKAAAKDTGMAVIAVSAVNRGASNDGNRAPKLRDLRDTGDLEFVADTILMAHYPDDDLYEDQRNAEWHVLKQRNGPTGVVSLRFNKPATRFEEMP